jgi:hypothetical protein
LVKTVRVRCRVEDLVHLVVLFMPHKLVVKTCVSERIVFRSVPEKGIVLLLLFYHLALEFLFWRLGSLCPFLVFLSLAAFIVHLLLQGGADKESEQTTQGNTRYDNARQDKTRQDKTRAGTRQRNEQAPSSFLLYDGVFAPSVHRRNRS